MSRARRTRSGRHAKALRSPREQQCAATRGQSVKRVRSKPKWLPTPSGGRRPTHYLSSTRRL